MFTLKSPEYIFMKCIQRQQNIAREGIQKDHYVTALFRMIYKNFCMQNSGSSAVWIFAVFV